MNVYILLYNECALYEVILASYFLKTKYNIITLGVDSEEVLVFEGFTVKCDKLIQAVESHKDDIVIVPGGNINLIKNITLLHNFLIQSNQAGTTFGAICSGVNLLKQTNLIEDMNQYSLKTTKLGDRFILAKPNEYVDFALALGIVGNIYADAADFNERVEFFKFFKTI